MKKVAIVQSNYIPWKGYFDIIRSVDELILYDEMQYTKNDWRNRNKIKSSSGTQWLTIPVETGGKFGQRIDETWVAGSKWKTTHMRTLQQTYARAPFFLDYADALHALYSSDETNLSLINEAFLRQACDWLGISTTLSRSTDYSIDRTADRSERLAQLCDATGATMYVSGPSASAYLSHHVFDQRGIGVEFQGYDGYPVYDQLYPPFVHEVSVLDLLFCAGPDAQKYLLPRR